MNNLNSFKAREKIEEMHKHKESIKNAVSELEQKEIAIDVANKGFDVIKLMFEQDPVHAMKSLVQTYKDSFKRGMFIGFIIGNLFMLTAITIAKIW